MSLYRTGALGALLLLSSASLSWAQTAGVGGPPGASPAVSLTPASPVPPVGAPTVTGPSARPSAGPAMGQPTRPAATGPTATGPYGNDVNTHTAASGALSRSESRNPPVDWNAENQYWSSAYSNTSYYNGSSYSAYQPAYQYGVTAYNEYGGMPYPQIDQARLREGWATARGNSSLDWQQAQQAARDAYQRAYNNNRNGSAVTISP